MPLRVRFPQVKPDRHERPETCSRSGGETEYAPHGLRGQVKPVRDIGYVEEVVGYR